MKISHVLVLVLILGYPLKAQNKEATKIRLSHQEKSIIEIASHTAWGNLINLEDALNDGLNNGLTVNETKEILLQLYAYAGFPRSIRGLQTLLAVLENRKTNGIEDQWGAEASPLTDSREKYVRGKEELEILIKAKLDGPKPVYQEFSPEMDRFLKEHLFADIFERDVLNHKQRELVTISIIASLGGLEPMLKSH